MLEWDEAFLCDTTDRMTRSFLSWSTHNIQCIFSEVKRWEGIPQRRELFTIEMLRYMIELVLESHPHIYGRDLPALAPQLNLKGDACAFCIDDIHILSDDKLQFSLDQVISNLTPTAISTQ